MLRDVGNRCIQTNAIHHQQFARSRSAVQSSQQKILLDFLKRNRTSSYGVAHGFGEIRSIQEYQERVPVTTYSDLESWILRAADGEPGVLTTEPVLAFEQTSGSSGARKLIPYTQSLLTEIRAGVGAWLFDLFRETPGLADGRQYWALSPLAQDRTPTPAGIPVGFENDLQYFEKDQQSLLRQLLIVPEGVIDADDVQIAMQRTIETLARCPDLRFISVWSPSFLELLLDHLDDGIDTQELWPCLEVISCWTSAASAEAARRLELRFPGVRIQGKGLLATEGVVTLPVSGTAHPVPATHAHFLEFLDGDGVPWLADALQPGQRYSVLMTTGAGLARYRIGDRVEAMEDGGLMFLGREGNVSDLCGEKLDEPFVEKVLSGFRADLGLASTPMLSPSDDHPPHYWAFVEFDSPPPPHERDTLASLLDTRLRESFHYNYSRDLGQLGPVRLCPVSDLARRYLLGCADLGQRASTAKTCYLRTETGWLERMTH